VSKGRLPHHLRLQDLVLLLNVLSQPLFKGCHIFTLVTLDFSSCLITGDPRWGLLLLSLGEKGQVDFFHSGQFWVSASSGLLDRGALPKWLHTGAKGGGLEGAAGQGVGEQEVESPAC